MLATGDVICNNDTGEYVAKIQILFYSFGDKTNRLNKSRASTFDTGFKTPVGGGSWERNTCPGYKCTTNKERSALSSVGRRVCP